MLRQRLTYIFMMLVNLLVFIFTNTRIPLISAVAMLAAPIISYIFLRIVASSLQIECTVKKSAVSGDTVDAYLSIKSGLNIYPGVVCLRRKVRSVMFDHEKEVLIESELSQSTTNINVSFKSLFCGLHEFSIYDVRIFDVFHLFSYSQKWTFTDTTLIYPKRIRLHTGRLSAALIENDGIIYDKYHHGSDKSEIFEIRDYAPGDDIKSIHWKLSSKLDKPVVREFSKPNNYKTMILCDLTRRFKDIDTDTNSISDNISLCSGISIDMMKNGIGHSICMLGKNIHEIAEINHINDIFEIRNSVMHVELGKDEFNTAFAFSDMEQSGGVSKLIYIGTNYDMDILMELSSRIDITIVTVSDDSFGTYTNGTIKIISLDSHELYNNSHSIEI